MTTPLVRGNLLNEENGDRLEAFSVKDQIVQLTSSLSQKRLLQLDSDAGLQASHHFWFSI
jgi:hypothetical protein